MTTPPAPHRCATADVALPADARILVMGGQCLPLTVPADATVVHCSPEEAADAAVGRALPHPAGDSPFDVVVVGQDVTSTVPARALLTMLRTVVGPHGQLLARFANAASGDRRLQALAGRPAAPGALTRADLHTALQDAGFRIDVDGRCYAAFSLDEAEAANLGLSAAQQQRLRAERESYVEHHAVAASPVWTDGERAATDLALATINTAPAAVDATAPLLVVASVGVLARDRRVGYRLSLPPRVALRFVDAADDKVLRRALAALPTDTPVLRTTPAVEPDARWLGRLWSAWTQGAGPVGCRLIDSAGTVVHASGDPMGRVFGAGTSWAEHPVVTADRSPATLRPPFLAAAESLLGTEPVPGRHLGDVAARCRNDRRGGAGGNPGAGNPGSASGADGEPRQPARLSCAFPGAVLFLDDAPPSRRPAAQQAQLAALWEALRAAGRTPVLHWDVADLLHARGAHRALERAGVLTFGGDASLELPAGTPPSQLQPDAATLAAALSAEAVVYLSGRRFSRDATDVALALPRAAVVVAAAGDTHACEADLVQELGTEGFAERVLALLAAPPAAPARQPYRVAERPAQPALTSIIIPVWNLRPLTQRCLDAIAASTHSPYEVIVVDNGSTDDTPQLLAERPVTVITNPGNLGFAAACNQGIDAARGEFVCVLNNDTEVTPGWLEALLAVLDMEDSVGLVGPRSNSISGPQVVPGAPPLSDAGAAHAWARSWTGAERGSWPARRLVGFCLLGRRRTFVEVGGFDTGYGIGNFEDDDLCDRVLASGRQLRVCDGAVVLHHGSATFQAARIDWSTTLRSGARRFAAGRAASPGGLLTAVVLSDGEPEAARAALAACAVVSDAGVVVERRSLVVTELAVESGLKARHRVVGADWHDGRALARVLRGLDTDFAVVLRARELLRCADWGQLRAALDASPRSALGVRVAAGGEVRIVAPGAGGGALGRRTEELLPGLAILPPAARRLAS